MRTPEEFQAEIVEFNDTIANPARRAHFEAQAFFCGTSLSQPNCPIQDDLTFNLGDLNVEILLTPGHTPANISVWIPDDGVLFTGDCLIREYLPNLDAGTKEDWQLWLKSIERIELLKPEFVVAGHGPVSRGYEIPDVINSVRQILKDSIADNEVPPQRCCVQIGSRCVAWTVTKSPTRSLAEICLLKLSWRRESGIGFIINGLRWERRFPLPIL